MNCNKCGTPIIPGENACRFCGAVDDFSIRVPVEPKPEIIGFDMYDEIQVVDFTIGEDDVSIDTEPKEEVVKIDEVIEIPSEPEVIDVVKEEPTIPIVNSVIEEPATARIPVEEVKNALKEAKETAPVEEKKLENEIIDIQEEKKPEEIISDEPVKEEIISEESIVDTPKPVEEKNKTKKSSKEGEPRKDVNKSSIVAIVLSILLIASIILNCFLLMGRASKVEVDNIGVSEVLLTTVYDNYELRLPNNWDTNSTNERYLLTYDNSKTWAASISFETDLDYDLVKENIEVITEKFGLNNYLFTSDYSKTINSNELYIFKGKYYSYATYVIINKIDNDTVAVTDLKFTGEVQEDVLDGILNSLTTISVKDMSNFLTNNFEFNDVTNVLEQVIAKEDE